MKLGRKLTLIFSGLLATLLLSSVSEAGNVKWNLSTVFPPGNFHVKNIRTFAEEAKKEIMTNINSVNQKVGG